jgi:hypothetical protein
VNKLLVILIVAVAVITGCGMFAAHAVRVSPLPKYALVQPDNAELGITQPLTQAVKVTVTLQPAEDDRDERAQVIWRFAFGLALGLVLCFLVAAIGISLSIR